MSAIDAILTFNREFVRQKQYEQFRTDRFPDKKMVILTCMDTRLIELLPRAMNLRNGDAKIIKTAGAIVSHPFGSVARSIIVAVYELNAHEVLVIGHHDCGMTGLSCSQILHKAEARGIPSQTLETLNHAGINLQQWLVGFKDVRDGVIRSVDLIKNHPLLPADVPVHGMLIHPETGALESIVDGYAALGATSPGTSGIR
jgi:carbonic anhydrase